ncbi:MAG: lipopolysaccharide core heptose(I) kinase [Phycisphaerales bacterium]|jgi:hypothetical protein|nr:lipopolysaccharide core heptose(I) kinase [Phycisphaerales bacterium]
MSQSSQNVFHVLPQYQALMRMIGLDVEAVFDHPQIVAWRKLPDRENCTLDADIEGKPIRLHIKRYLIESTGAADEVKAIELLRDAGVPTVPLVGWGKLVDGRSFVITEDLAGYRDAEKMIAAGTPFETLLQPTADLAAKLHAAGLHHRDLYLCHFFANVGGGVGAVDVKLIDAARVARMNHFLTRWRWVIKDLAQFWYSTTTLPGITDEQRNRWLNRYAERREICWLPRLRAAIKAKSNAIARHDAKLKRSQPTRNISIPSEDRPS